MTLLIKKLLNILNGIAIAEMSGIACCMISYETRWDTAPWIPRSLKAKMQIDMSHC